MSGRTYAGGAVAAFDLLAQYELLEEVGATPQARVFRARDRVLDQIVAVKLLREETEHPDETATLLYVAARAAARLNHPHIANVYDQGPHEQTAFLTREYLDGPNLAEFVARAGALSVRRAVALALPLLDALAIAHKQGIVHGALHPGNILLHGNGFRAVLTDFGARGAYPSTAEECVPYLAPEGVISLAADLYSIAAILVLLLTGQPPTVIAAETRIAGVSRALDRVVRQALAADPTARPPSASALRDALAAATGVALTVVWPDPWEGTLDTAVRVAPPRADRQTLRRRRVRQAATLMLAGSLAAASIVGLASIAQISGANPTPTSVPIVDGDTPDPTPEEPTPEPPSVAVPTMPAAQVIKTPTPLVPTVTPANDLGTGPFHLPSAFLPGDLAGPLPTGTPTGGSVNATISTFSPLHLQGAFQRFDGQRNDQPTVALYGVDSGYNEGTLTFELAALPTGRLVLVVTGQDDVLPDECRIEVVLNGVMLYSGPSGFPNAPSTDEEESLWGQLRLSLPAGVLQHGPNTLTIRNTMPGRRIGLPAVLIGTLELVREE